MLVLSNRDLRWLWLERNLLARAPVGKLDLLQTVRDLGFVQIDTIQNVVRAHHHILWSRNQNYRPCMIDRHLGRGGDLFEHFTHDAAMIPVEYFPYWRRQFHQLARHVGRWLDTGDRIAGARQNEIVGRIAREGPLCTRDFDTKIDGEQKMWARPPHKRTLDFLWYAGVLTTSHREKFTKFYDLSERVIPEQYRDINRSTQEQIDWLCDAALSRLGVATAGDVAKFWGAVSLAEVKTWIRHRQPNRGRVQQHDGRWQEVLCDDDLVLRIERLNRPTKRLRIINPFDPAIRDRKRLLRYFGFDYTAEIFVPRSRRKWGYYVYPLLQGGRFVGRIELRAERKSGTLRVVSFWSEPGVPWTEKRNQALDPELKRFACLGGLDEILWSCDRHPS